MKERIAKLEVLVEAARAVQAEHSDELKDIRGKVDQLVGEICKIRTALYLIVLTLILSAQNGSFISQIAQFAWKIISVK
jgi:hypothetical protein